MRWQRIALLAVLAACSGSQEAAVGNEAGVGATLSSNDEMTGGSTTGSTVGTSGGDAASSTSLPGQDASANISNDLNDAGVDGMHDAADSSVGDALELDLCGFATDPAKRRYLADTVEVPVIGFFGGIPHAYDLNGDGVPDNAFGATSMHYGQSFSWQSAMDQLVDSGRLRLLIDLAADDPTFTDAACAQVEFSRAQSLPSTDAGVTYEHDVQAGKATLVASIDAGTLDGHVASSQSSTSVKLVLSMGPIVGSADGDMWPGVVEVSVTVVHTSFAITDNSLLMGELHGFISASDLSNVLIPALAENLNALAANVESQVYLYFDTGGAADPACGSTCRNDDGSCSVADDKIVTACEVATEASGLSLLVPDVQMLDGSGNYAPNPANTAPDSYSIGLGFTA